MEIAQDKAGDAEYNSGYLYMTLPFDAKSNLADYSIVELGTFVHEYVHFLQNISTPWGLYESMRLYERISSCIEQLSKEKEEFVYAPIAEEYEGKHDHILKILHYGRGSDKDDQGLSVYNLKIADQSDFSHHRKSKDIGNHKIPIVILEFNTNNYGRRSILLGAWAIKESMAAMIQKRIDPSSESRHADIPYSLIQRYAKDRYPNIAADEDKLIAICYASLFSMSPAESFIDLASFANDNPALSTDQILHKHFSSSIKFNGNSVRFENFCADLSSRYNDIISKLLVEEPVFIPKMIEACRFRAGNYPLLWFLDGNLNVGLIKDFIDAAGAPIVMGAHNTSIIPYIENQENESMEIINLIGYETIFKYFTSQPPTCPRLKQCEEADKDTSNCAYTPWIRDDDCPMTEVASWLGLKDKHIIKAQL